MRRPIRPADFARYRALSEPSFSPDGKKVAFSVRQVNLEDDAYESDVYVADLARKKVEKFTSGKKDSDPIWSPDGSSILFTSKRGFAKDEKGAALYSISSAGGEARLLAKCADGVDSPRWSPDSKTIFYLSNVTKKEKDDVRVIKRFGYWFNGLGFTYNKRKHLFSVASAGGKPRQLTRGKFDVTGFSVSNDGKRMAYLAACFDLKPYISDLFILNVRSGIRAKLTHSRMEITTLAWSPDGGSVALLGDDLKAGFSSHRMIWVVNARTGRLAKVDGIDRNKANTLNSDVRSKAHGPHNLAWTKNGIYYLQAEGGSVGLYRMRPGRKPEQIIGGNRSVEGYDVHDGKVAFVSMTDSTLEELFLLSGRERQVTRLNDQVSGELEIRKPEPFHFRASDGQAIDGWVLMPKAKGRVPGILCVHGGPKTAYGYSFMHEFQSFAAAGHAVIYINPRGSDGYSEGFADIRGRYGTRDYDDLMEGLDFALKKSPRIDARRLGIAGGSYGGYMTNWAIGHTDRFRAAVTDRSIASWISMWGTSDIGPHFTTDQMGGDPWNAEEKLMADSPLRYAPLVKTPLLVIHSMEDYRCPMPEGVQFFTALKQLGKEAEMVLFPGENHDLSRIGKPKHRVARLGHYLRWFNAHLKNSS